MATAMGISISTFVKRAKEYDVNWRLKGREQ